MFANRFALHRREFTKIKNSGKLYQSTNFGVLVLGRDGVENPRFGVIISNKVSKLSTHRNRIRRAFRDVLRRNWKNVDNSLDMIFLVKPGIERIMVSDIMKEVEKFLNEKKYNECASKS